MCNKEVEDGTGFAGIVPSCSDPLDAMGDLADQYLRERDAARKQRDAALDILQQWQNLDPVTAAVLEVDKLLAEAWRAE